MLLFSNEISTLKQSAFFVFITSKKIPYLRKKIKKVHNLSKKVLKLKIKSYTMKIQRKEVRKMKTYKGMNEEQLKQYARDNNITHCVRELIDGLGISLREALISCYEANEFAKKFRKEKENI